MRCFVLCVVFLCNVFNSKTPCALFFRALFFHRVGFCRENGCHLANAVPNSVVEVTGMRDEDLKSEVVC